MHWRKGIGLHADAPTGLSTAAHRLTREVEIKSKSKSKSNGERNGNSSGNCKSDGDRVSDRRAWARDARCF